jgi:DNA-directed RNA polymerase specialized sigma subunit
MSTAAHKRFSAQPDEDGEKAGEITPVRVKLKHIEDALLVLDERERLVLALRYYEKLSQPAVAWVLRLGADEVERIEQKAIDGVVKYLADAGSR